ARLGAGVLQEASRQWSHVLAPLAQRRQAEHQALKAEVEVLAEPTLRDAALEGPIAGGDDPHVHRGGTCRPDPVEGLFLKNAEELRLVVGPQLTDLVQEDRSAVGLLEIPPPLRDGAGEATPDVAEQLALEQLGRDGGHVDRDERRTGAGAQAVGRPREQLLACSGFARYQNRPRRARPRGLLPAPRPSTPGAPAPRGSPSSHPRGRASDGPSRTGSTTARRPRRRPQRRAAGPRAARRRAATATIAERRQSPTPGRRHRRAPSTSAARDRATPSARRGPVCRRGSSRGAPASATIPSARR